MSQAKERENPAMAKAADGTGATSATVPEAPSRTADDKPPQIGLDDLMQRLADPDVPEEDLLPYITTIQEPRAGLAPVLMPNENVRTAGAGEAHERVRGDLGLGFLNSVFQARRRRVFERRMAARDGRPVLLAEGDSWFQYPLFFRDVVDQIVDEYNVFCVSSAGAELRTMVAEAEYRDHLRRLSDRGVVFRAFLFSGAGNDVVGDQMRAFLRPFSPEAEARDLIDAEAFRRKTDIIIADYERIIATVHSVLPDLPIVIHGYDYSVPLPQQGFHVPPRDGWLGAPMRALGISDGEVQVGIVRIMMDAVNESLLNLAGGNVPGGRHPRVFYVDNRNIVQGRWADELHPNDEGFRAVADNMRQVMRRDAGIP